jgi:hypothetical protein
LCFPISSFSQFLFLWFPISGMVGKIKLLLNYSLYTVLSNLASLLHIQTSHQLSSCQLIQKLTPILIIGGFSDCSPQYLLYNEEWMSPWNQFNIFVLAHCIFHCSPDFCRIVICILFSITDFPFPPILVGMVADCIHIRKHCQTVPLLLVATFYGCEQNVELTQSSLFLHTPHSAQSPPPPPHTHTVVQRWWWWWYDRQWHWFSPNGYFQSSGPFLHCCEEYVPHKHLQEGNILFFPYIFFYMMIFQVKMARNGKS